MRSMQTYFGNLGAFVLGANNQVTPAANDFLFLRAECRKALNAKEDATVHAKSWNSKKLFLLYLYCSFTNGEWLHI